MAHLRVITAPRCRCGKLARVELYNRVNACLGRYCRTCGDRMLRAQQARENGDSEK